ncbi:type VII toxin-antitoxin system HepT family RNase toxin [Fusobacterium sp. THCT1E2]
MKDDIIINKIETIKKCIKRVKEEYENNPSNLENCTKQDSMILNIQRLCEAGIDLATHVIRINKYGIFQSSKETFQILEKNNIISKELSKKLQGMVGFRNIAVHDYQAINLNILQKIIETHLEDTLELAREILKYEINIQK